MSTDFIFRILGMVGLATLGVFWGITLGQMANEPVEFFAVIGGLLGALVGLVLTPFLTTRPVRGIRRVLAQVSIETFFASLAGMLTGLILATLLATPLSMLPGLFGQYSPILVALIFTYLGVVVFAMRHQDILSLFRSVVVPSRSEPAEFAKGGSLSEFAMDRVILLDTSVIIDGRIADIANTGFLPGIMLIPRFVLNELQYIADSTDSLRRQRGRRGLDVLAAMQKDQKARVRITDMDVEGTHAVDDKLIVLARRLRCPILTNDYNLNKVADLQGVLILNVNELANAVKAVLLPGESLSVEIIQEGKEHSQGVGFLDDGTMIVVENGAHYLGKRVYAVVTKVLQTAAGRMIFARPEEE